MPNCERMELALKCPVTSRYHTFRIASNGEWIKLAHYRVQWCMDGTGSELSSGEWSALAQDCDQRCARGLVAFSLRVLLSECLCVCVCVCVGACIGCSRQILHMIERCYITQLYRDRRSDATTSSPHMYRGTVCQRSAGATSWQLRDYRATHGLCIVGWKLYSVHI